MEAPQNRPAAQTSVNTQTQFMPSTMECWDTSERYLGYHQSRLIDTQQMRGSRFTGYTTDFTVALYKSGLMDLIPTSKPRLWKNKADFFRPFRAAATEAGENIQPLYDPELHRDVDDEPDLKELNNALAALVSIFPDVEPEVFREMLLSISDESRLQIVTEHLLTKKAKWVRGRYRAPKTPKPKERRRESDPPSTNELNISPEETFRSDSYKTAVQQLFYQEFRNVSHSSIRAVLAEQNFSYTLARPILQQLSTKSWRYALSNLWSRKSSSTAARDHASIMWQTVGSVSGRALPAVKSTGNAQLDRELYDLYVAPALQAEQQDQLSSDYQLSLKLNEQEATEAHALFDCECCYSPVPFEYTATCDDGCHALCFDCVRRTVNEALFGQGWARAVDLERSSVRCFAPTTQDCHGVISPEIVRRALSGGGGTDDAWNEFQLRTATDVLSKSRLSLQRCPFCSYAEVNDTPRLRLRPLPQLGQYATAHIAEPLQIILGIIAISLLIFIVPTAIGAAVLWLALQVFPSAKSILPSSWSRVYQKRNGLKFRCLNPSCGGLSCTRCRTRWHDPHTCFEKEQTSLRTAIESSATAAVKRTCPKCLLSFVKSSGCNKLVCNCGYTMCYTCRQEITSKEGYGHFCQHFRPHGGRCAECERCDLYGDEDEEAAIRAAAEAAERAWKEKESVEANGASLDATRALVDVLVGQGRGLKVWEQWLDAVVDIVAA